MKHLVTILLFATSAFGQARWTEQKANDWYKRQPWLVGANYVPTNAINQLEMWQEKTFDPEQIEKEFGWARSIGMNTMRVFLHDLLWEDPDGFKTRIDAFLRIADKHGIKPMFVLFDSVWDPEPRLGKQRAPKPGVHNSGWVQGPGARSLQDPSEYPRLEAYVKGVVGAFAKDRRVLAWDVWNEPDNPNASSYAKGEPPNKVELVNALLPKVFEWARSVSPTQPLTAGVWVGEWTPDKLNSTAKIQIDQSDIISFHDYNDPAQFEKRIKSLQQYKRPILCTEYMARGNRSTFEGSLPIAQKYGVAAYNWGFVAGKTQTHLPWDSWKQPYVDGREPTIWFHEIFKPNGEPYRKQEVDLIKRLTQQGKAKSAA
jgi:hypothetical protein